MTESLTVTNVFDRWSQIKAKQGFIGKAWNEIKEATNFGQSASDCESMLKAYKNHEITTEEAMEYIEAFNKKQNDMTNLFANITTGVASIALATVTCGAGVSIGGLAALKLGAPIGMLTKALIKLTDRATNKVKNDELDTKEIIKDVVSGATAGAASAVSSGVSAGIKAGKIGVSILNGAKCGAICGSASSAINYLADTALDEDRNFSFGELVTNSVVGAAVSGTVGGVVGAGIYGINSSLGNIGKEVVHSTGEQIVIDSTSSSARKTLATIFRNWF